MRQIRVWLLLSATIAFVSPISAQPYRVIGNMYFVGGEYGAYLMTTPEGHILHDTGTNAMHDVIVSNVQELGFDVRDIRIILSSHAHFDHVQGHAAMKQLTGAQVVALGGDAAALAAGQDNSAGGFAGLVPVEVDRVIQDGDIVTLGGMTLRALWVPGHTQGATMWMTTVREGGHPYAVAFRGGEIPNAGVPLFDNPRHPTVVEDTLWTLYRLKRRDPPDLVLHNHPQNVGRPLNPTLPVNASCTFCLDAEAWTALVEGADATFKERLRQAGGQAHQ